MIKDPLNSIIEDIEANGIEAIKGFIERKISEQFFVDFKRTEHNDYADKRSIGNDDRKNLAKALSGFSNSEGGVLIWGVDEKKGIANGLIPINNSHLFSTLLNKEFSTLIIPINTKVRNIVVSDDNNSGYVITVIPKSENVPHEYIAEGRFYMRTGDSFKPVPYSVLAGMFGKRPAPNVNLVFTYDGNLINGQDVIEFSFGAMLINKGRGIAHNIFANTCILGAANMIATEVFNVNDFVGGNFNGNHTFLISKEGFRLGIEQPVQPYKFHCKIEKSINMSIGIEFLYGAEGQIPNRLTIEHSKEKIREMVGSIDSNENNFVKGFLSNFLVDEIRND